MSGDNGKPENSGWFKVQNGAADRISEIGLLGWAVFTVLCRFSDAQGTCYPSQATVAGMCGVTDRAVRKAIAKLIEAGMVKTETRATARGQRASNLYRLASLPPDTRRNVGTGRNVGSGVGRNVGSGVGRNVGSYEQDHVEQDHVEQYPLNPPRGKRRATFTEADIDGLTWPASLDTPEARAALREWLAYKRERGQAYKTARGPQAVLIQFAGLGVDALRDAITASIGNNWAGLFPPKPNGNGASKHGSQNGNGRKPIGPAQRFDPAKPVRW